MARKFTFLVLLQIIILGYCVMGDVHDKKCNEIKSLKNKLDNHRHMILENCIFEMLTRKFTNETGISSLKSVPPPSGDPIRPTTVTLSNVKFEEIKDMGWGLASKKSVEGTTIMRWNDERLRWDAKEWKIDRITLDSDPMIWMPEPHTMSVYMFGISSDNQKIQVRSNGTVTLNYRFVVLLDCQDDPGAFLPSSRQKCCGPFSMAAMDAYRTYVFHDKKTVFEHSGKLSKKDAYESEMIRLGYLDSDRTFPELKVCADVTYRSRLLKIELVMPVLTAVLFKIVAPIFGQLKMQLYVKVFALTLQYFCFQLLTFRTQSVKYLIVVPGIYKFYESTFIITAISVFVTLFFLATSAINMVLPLPHNLELFSDFVLKFVGFSRLEEGEECSVGEKETKNVNVSWRRAFLALNNALSVLLTVIYILIVLSVGVF